MPDCFLSGCTYTKKRKGMRAVGSCKCDECPKCQAHIKPNSPAYHRQWCDMQAWIPPHHRGKMGVKLGPTIINVNIPLVPLRPLLIMHPVKIEEDDDGSAAD